MVVQVPSFAHVHSRRCLRLPSTRRPFPSTGASALVSVMAVALLQRPLSDVSVSFERDVSRVREEGEEEDSQRCAPEAELDCDAADVLDRQVCMLRRRSVVLVLDNEFGYGKLHRAYSGDFSFDVCRCGLVSRCKRAVSVPPPLQCVDTDSLAYGKGCDWWDDNVKRSDFEDTCSTR